MRVFVALVLLFGLVQGQEIGNLLVETTQGLVRGIRSEDGDYSMFLGIPFGKVNEENPFGASIPHPNFETIYEANDDSVECPQVHPGTGQITGSLDCLRLNIYVPDNPSGDRLPVMFWIFGGGFVLGSGDRNFHGPKFLVKHDVILVSINYRLGPYGFFCLDTPEVPGNQGIKDQMLALRWVNRNIAAFGGDPDKVTIFGESAGSGSVEYHLYSNQEKLYHQAIMQSGTVLGPTFIQESDPIRPITIAAELGFQTNDISEAIAFLAKTDVTEVVATSAQLGLRYRPCAEKEFEGVESIVTDHPLNLDLPKVRDISILAGFTSVEELPDFVNKPEGYYETLNVFNDMLIESFRYDDEFEKMEDLVRRYYIGDEKSSEETRLLMCDFQSDFKFNYPIQKSVHKYIRNGVNKVYQYFFSYDGGRNVMKIRHNITDPGAVHTDTLGYLFDPATLRGTPSDEDQLIIDRMTTMWTNFVKYGDPTPEITELLPVKWLPATANSTNYLNIDSELKLERRPYQDRLAFWELFFERNDGKLKARLDY